MARSKKDGAPTIEDVARAAGVSTATISRCLNLPERVAQKTRERVMEAVRELGYSPNFGAKVMAAKRTNTLGAVIPTMENAIFARGLQAFQEELAHHGFMLLVASSSYEPELEEEQIRSLLARGADGLLLIGFDRTSQVYDYLDRCDVPVMVAWNHRSADRLPSIGFDNRSSMRALADEVMGQGHRTIGIISGPTDGNDRARERLEAVREAAEAHGITTNNIEQIECPYSIENGAISFDTLMAAKPETTAVICGNDVLAVGALKAARAGGLSVPTDISITGFDDIELAQIAQPGLTTVHVPHRKMGTLAAQALVGALTKGETMQGQLLETHIVTRESLGPPRAGKMVPLR